MNLNVIKLKLNTQNNIFYNVIFKENLYPFSTLNASCKSLFFENLLTIFQSYFAFLTADLYNILQLFLFCAYIVSKLHKPYFFLLNTRIHFYKLIPLF